MEVKTSKCTGCGICAEVCPNNAIEMKRDYRGFSTPIVCEKRSSYSGVLAGMLVDALSEKQYYCYRSDDMIRWRSQGGGAFLTYFDQASDNGDHTFFAPMFTENYMSMVYKKYFKNMSGLLLLNPFIEGEINYAEIEESLKRGKKVVFYGIPCVISSLRVFLKKDYENLLTIGFLCKGVTSTFVWGSYLRDISGKRLVSNVKINSKEFGCRESIKVQFSDDAENYEELETGHWLTAFESGLSLRERCLCCEEKSAINADVTLTCLYDNNSFNDMKGATFIRINSERGLDFTNVLRDSKIGELTKLTEGQAENFFARVIPNNEEREDFFELCYTHGYYKASCLVFGNAINQHYKKYALEYFAGDPIVWKQLDSNVWSQIKVDGFLYLKANGNRWNRIFLPLYFPLVQGLRYRFSIRLRCNTDNKEIRIMLSDKISEGARFINLTSFATSTFNGWMNLTGSFYAREGFWKNMMLASTDFIGKDPWVCFDWIRIWEE